MRKQLVSPTPMAGVAAAGGRPDTFLLLAAKENDVPTE